MPQRTAAINSITYSTVGPQPENGQDPVDHYVEYYSGLIGKTESIAKHEYNYGDADIDCAVIQMLKAQIGLAKEGRDPDGLDLKHRLEALNLLIDDIPEPLSCGQKVRKGFGKLYNKVMSYFSGGGRTKRSKRSKSRRTRRTRR